MCKVGDIVKLRHTPGYYVVKTVNEDKIYSLWSINSEMFVGPIIEEDLTVTDESIKQEHETMGRIYQNLTLALYPNGIPRSPQ